MGKYLDMIRQHERTQPEEALTPQQALDEAPAVHPGDWIEWQRAGTVQQGFVDFLQCDADGTTWAFVTTLADNTWAAVNVRYLTVIPEADKLSTDVAPPPEGKS
jgi:hypothetical protein